MLSEICVDAAGVRTRRRGELFGPPILPVTAIAEAEASDGPLWVRLGADPDLLPEQAGPMLARVEVDCPFESLDDAVALAQGDPRPLPAPLAVFVDGGTAGRGWAAESAERIAAAGAHPGLDADLADVDVADFLAVLAHSDAGFVARAATGEQVVAILAATVAALRGDDIRAAYVGADPAPVASLSTAAAGAVREVLLGIAVDDAAAVEAHLRACGITATLAKA
ncbi:hypothetical protein FK531_01395 [Rhodococcus spelaei]|uniref:Uncharacterized protein n=1 Tax=Rhodococcus spelaei TaxID=2546320 RepID=A0A541BSC0_9NOCA|nr:hypothetical protein FK531_01395 [Rhodococcus spelaei]